MRSGSTKPQCLTQLEFAAAAAMLIETTAAAAISAKQQQWQRGQSKLETERTAIMVLHMEVRSAQMAAATAIAPAAVTAVPTSKP